MAVHLPSKQKARVRFPLSVFPLYSFVVFLHREHHEQRGHDDVCRFAEGQRGHTQGGVLVLGGWIGEGFHVLGGGVYLHEIYIVDGRQLYLTVVPQRAFPIVERNPIYA